MAFNAEYFFYLGDGLSQKLSMSLILNYESAVINTTEKAASLSLIVSSSSIMDHKLQHGFWLPHG